MSYSAKTLRKRKFLLVLPIMALPFITLAFWALGGGKGTNQTQGTPIKGVNAQLPDAQISVQAQDKMSLYNLAAKDSAALKSSQRQDELFSLQLDTASSTAKASNDLLTEELPGKTGDHYGTTKSGADKNEMRIRSKLDQLELSLNKPAAIPDKVALPENAIAAKEAEPLQQMMQTMQQGSEQDPEMARLNGMLEKVLDIQHPDRVKEKLREQSLKNRGRVYTLNKPYIQANASLLQGNVRDTNLPAVKITNAFYGINSNAMTPQDNLITVAAVVQETQTVVSGATIKMRLTEDVFINGTLIPKNNFVFGNCMVEGERLKITIPSMRYGNNLFPVTLTVYDLDGLEGIRIPGAINRDVSKESADRAIQSMQLTTLDPSLGAQAIGAGIEATKGLFSKKVKLIRVTVKADYPVLLMDEKAKQEIH